MDKINPYPITSSVAELRNAERIIPKLHFTENINNKKYKTIENTTIKNGKDKIKCQICSIDYTRYNKSKHYKTKHHIFCESLNKKWRDTIINKTIN